MPSVLKIRVIEARELPIMDRQRKTTDAYVEVRVGGGSLLDTRTSTVRNNLNPKWGFDVRLEVRDEGALQDEPIEFRVMDSDVLSADDPVGTVYIDINPLLARVANARVSSHDAANRSPAASAKKKIDSSPSMNDGSVSALDHQAERDEQRANDTIEGWFPIFDTMQGTRGDLYLSVRVQFFGDNLNPFRMSSAGIQFFSTSMLATSDLVLKRVCGFVEELVVHDDPEYEQANRIRSAQKSNEIRETFSFFFLLSLFYLKSSFHFPLFSSCILAPLYSCCYFFWKK